MKKLFLGVFFGLLGSLANAGPMVEVYNCTLNDGKTYEDLNKMMNTFSSMMKKAGLEDSYQAHIKVLDKRQNEIKEELKALSPTKVKAALNKK